MYMYPSTTTTSDIKIIYIDHRDICLFARRAREWNDIERRN